LAREKVNSILPKMRNLPATATIRVVIGGWAQVEIGTNCPMQKPTLAPKIQKKEKPS